MHILFWIISGVVAGWLTGLVMRGRGYGLLGDLAVGFLGGIVGGWVFGSLGMFPVSVLGEIVVAFVGGILFVAMVRFLRRL